MTTCTLKVGLANKSAFSYGRKVRAVRVILGKCVQFGLV